MKTTETRREVLEARVLRTVAIRALEAAAGDLMERAGTAVAELALTMTADRSGPIVVLAGPGNNGGDALVAAAWLHRRGIPVKVALLAPEKPYRGAALLAWSRWCDAVGDWSLPVDLRPEFAGASLVVDGLFGIGFDRAPDGKAHDWIVALEAARCPVLSIDVPSGVDGDTGHVAGVAVRADRTITFIGRKPGLHTGDGLDHCGDVVVDLLGLDAAADPPMASGAVGALNRPSLFVDALPPRRRNSHKGSHGSVAVIGGNDGMVGAALMASRMALHAGAGRVYVRLLAVDGPRFDVVQPELMLRTSLDGVDATAIAIGPGLGHDAAALAALDDALASDAALVIDADALNAIARNAAAMGRLAARARDGRPRAVLTPHPLEAARLLGVDVAAVQRDRIAAATRLARTADSVVILKGAGSVIAEPSGAWVINPTGSPALATGGTGDVLCGLVAALLAQRLTPIDAARTATWVHGAAADTLVRDGVGPIGLAATELIGAIRFALNRLASRR